MQTLVLILRQEALQESSKNLKRRLNRTSPFKPAPSLVTKTRLSLQFNPATNHSSLEKK
ncbi:hypothetical protein OIU77_013325 [Salix suchowensis]|uniref:Uncharacterized protein n=1 Tax=Salix suchowensis TaxID=1278906 RepID=A0ABQ8ZTN8_9ROSI|nr:hypothetical protein OIU77_013325 [Salix suchowensis]